MKIKLLFVLLVISLLFFSCFEENVLPKPKAMLRLEYSRPVGADFDTKYYSLNYNKNSNIKKNKEGSMILEYPEMNATIFITYKKINNNLEGLIKDAERLSYDHAAQADGIRPRVYENSQEKVYGTFFEVSGNAASQAQFYVTDSVQHFVSGSLYFSSKPNYDSIYPAAAYLQQDIAHIMESMRWK